MNVNFSDIVSLVHSLIWPIVVVVAILLLRQHLPNLVKALSARISSLSVASVKLEFFAATQPTNPEILRVLEDIREPSSPIPTPTSGIPALYELARSSSPADYLIIDLRDGQAWLTSRLYTIRSRAPPLVRAALLSICRYTWRSASVLPWLRLSGVRC